MTNVFRNILLFKYHNCVAGDMGTWESSNVRSAISRVYDDVSLRLKNSTVFELTNTSLCVWDRSV